jgi:hypothetical protein
MIGKVSCCYVLEGKYMRNNATYCCSTKEIFVISFSFALFLAVFAKILNRHILETGNSLRVGAI